MRNWYLWLGVTTLWVLQKWLGVLLMTLLAAYGVGLDAVLEFFGLPRLHLEPDLDSAARWTALLSAILIGIWWTRKHVWSHNKLKQSLEHAIENLDSNNIHLRTYVIDDILEVSRMSPQLHARAMNALADFIRRQSPVSQEPGRSVTVKKKKFGAPGARYSQVSGKNMHSFAREQATKPRKSLEPDVAKAIDALSGRRQFFDDPRRWIDLSEADLSCANMERGNFRRFSFAGSNMRYAQLEGADVRHSQFAGAILNDAVLTGANATKAGFAGALMQRAHFDGAMLTGANFMGADLYDVSMQRADARAVNFTMAQMWRFGGGLTDFKDADLAQANLEGADLRSAKNLSREQIEGTPPTGFGKANTDKNTRFPWSTDEELRASGVVG